jgi:PPOX class probable F420-dependent enzyme
MTEDPRREALLDLLPQHKLGVLVTLKRDGRPQLSNVNYAYDAARQLVLISVTADRAKSRNLDRDPRASFHVSSDDGWAWTVVEGTATQSDVATDPYDEGVEELITLYRLVLGEHPNWDEYRAAMVADRRRIVRIGIEHVYGQPHS